MLHAVSPLQYPLKNKYEYLVSFITLGLLEKFKEYFDTMWILMGRCHHIIKFFVIYLSITINVCLFNHRIYFFTSKSFSQVHHDHSQFLTVNETIAVLKVKFVTLTVVRKRQFFKWPSDITNSFYSSCCRIPRSLSHHHSQYRLLRQFVEPRLLSPALLDIVA